MSANIPLELQEEIIKRVPVQSLLRFRSVSKEWKALIDSPDFGDDYCLRQSQPHRLLIRYVDDIKQDDDFTNSPLAYRLNGCKYKYVSIADDDTFHQQQISTATLPKSLNNFRDSIIVGCSHGLVCFYGSGSRMVVVWNPWIRKSVDVSVPNVLFGWYETILGFGVSPQTKDPMIVKIISSFHPVIDNSVPIPWRVAVFTLSSGTWKTPSCSINNLPCRNSIKFCWGQVALDGFIYWLAFEWINMDGRFRCHNLIMSFDLSSEGFEEVCLPNNLARLNHYDLSISKCMESVVVLKRDQTRTSCGVWMMGQGVTKPFTKLFSLMTQVPPLYEVCGFMKNGELIVDNGSDALFTYDTFAGRFKDLGIVGVGHKVRFSVKSYMETLLLIDQ